MENMTEKKYEVGQRWSYRAPKGYENSYFTIGAIEEVPEVGDIICVTLVGVPAPGGEGKDGATPKQTIAFVPFARDAIDSSAVMHLGEGSSPPHFKALFADWKEQTDGEDFLPIPIPMFIDMIMTSAQD